MSETSMLFLPLPFFTFLLCGAIAVLVWRLDLGVRAASIFFTVMFAMFSVESLLVGLRFGYGIAAYVPLQRVMPLFAGPLMYLGFKTLATPEGGLGKLVGGHLALPLLMIPVAGLVVNPVFNLDLVITASYMFYIIALILLWRKGPDTLVHVPLDRSDQVLNWMLRGAGLLCFALILDTAIAIDFALGGGSNVSALISYGSIPLIVLLLALLFALPSLLSVPRSHIKPQPHETSETNALEADVRALLEDTKLFLDPTLSAQRLARRMHVPVRNLSTAINQSQNMNVSHYVNQFRLKHAAALLHNSDASVAEVMTQSGFLTRSNFYRAFQQTYGQSPASYREDPPKQDR